MAGTMTLSQALRRIKAVKGEIATITGRMVHNVSWMEPGNKPNYVFKDLAEKQLELTVELAQLKGRLAKTNCHAMITVRGMMTTLQTSVFALAELKARKLMLQQLPIHEGEEKRIVDYEPGTRKPVYETVKHVSAISEVERDSQVAQIEREIAEVNGMIEDANHRTQLEE